MRIEFNRDIKDNRITSLAPIYYWKKPESDKSNIYIRWFILDQKEVLYAGNKSLCEVYYFQVDIFSSGDYDLISDRVKEVMIEKRYLLTEQADEVEELKDDTLLYHKVLRFKKEKFKGVD